MFAPGTADIRQLAHQHAIACAQYAATKKPKPRRAKNKTRRTTQRATHYGQITDGILCHLRDNGPATAEQIALALSMDKLKIRYRCKQLYREGRLIHAVEGRGNIPAIYAVTDMEAA